MSLRDQLLKSGLATKQQAKKAKRAANKQQHKKQKSLAKGESLEKDDVQKEIEKKQIEQKEQDRKLNLELVEMQKSFQATSLVYEGQVDPGGPIPYYFRPQNSQKIRVIHVSKGLQKMLSEGRLGIATLQDDRWYILNKDDCHRLKTLHPEFLVCFHPEEKK